MAKTRMIVQRDTTPHSAAEIKRRLVFVVYALSIPAGVFALITSYVHHQPRMALAGACALAVFVALHFTRNRWGARELAKEIAQNPFKAKRVPKDPNDSLI